MRSPVLALLAVFKLRHHHYHRLMGVIPCKARCFRQWQDLGHTSAGLLRTIQGREGSPARKLGINFCTCYQRNRICQGKVQYYLRNICRFFFYNFSDLEKGLHAVYQGRRRNLCQQRDLDIFSKELFDEVPSARQNPHCMDLIIRRSFPAEADEKAHLTEVEHDLPPYLRRETSSPVVLDTVVFLDTDTPLSNNANLAALAALYDAIISPSQPLNPQPWQTMPPRFLPPSDSLESSAIELAVIDI